MSAQSSDSPVKRALAEVRELRERLERAEKRHEDPIAIIGIGCRFPGGVEDAGSYWDLLAEGRDAITPIPADRWDVDAYYDPNPDAPGKMTTRWGGFLDDIDKFDADFFGIAAREAGSLDPQQRMLLEVSWAALEDAGIDPGTLIGSRTGVFAGIAAFDYAQLQIKANDPTKIDAYFATGGSHSVATGRISYVLGLKGPCIAVDTACSASLVAVHLACQSLRTGECDLALTGGVSVLLLPELFVDFSNARMMAADGRCKSFDAAADGYVRGEGCGMIVLKRLSDAQAAGDRILGVIRGSAVNHDGRSSGLTAPNGPSQVAVIRSALEQGGIAPERVGYVEAHGTGTSLGDPIEVQALAAALGAGRSADRPVRIGSVKTNFGHLEAAAGIAGLIKAVLCLQHGELPKSLHFNKPNPVVPWDRLPVEVVTKHVAWSEPAPRVAGVSSFGFSGTNAHVVLEEFRAPAPAQSGALERPVHLLAVSGRTSAALAANAKRMARALSASSTADLADFAYTANTGRSHFAHRLAVLGRTREELVRGLENPAAASATDSVLTGTADGVPSICMLFSGQGSQYVGMAKALFDGLPSFRKHLERCDAVLNPLLGKSVVDILYSADAAALQEHVRFAQPAITALQCALFEQWKSWGVVPGVVMGHSLGEYAAAIAAGVVSLEDGLTLVAKRAALIEDRCPEGRMLAVRASEAAVSSWLAEAEGNVTIAAINGPESVAVSGGAADIERFAAVLTKRGVQHQPLASARAFHHATLAPALDEFAAFARTIAHRAPEIPMVSNLTGRLFDDGVGPDALYWPEQARRPVRFLDGLEAVRARGFDIYLEVGPSSTLTALAAGCFGDAPTERLLASLRRGRDDWEQLLGTVAGLYVCGVKIDWRALDADYPRRKIAVPGYAFQRKSYWYTDRSAGARAAIPPASEPPVEAAAMWRNALRACKRQAAHVPIDLDLASYGKRWALLDTLTTEYIVRTLRDLGVFRAAGERHTAAAIVGAAEILPMYETLVERWLDRLADKGLLAREDREYVSKTPLREPAIESALSAARAAFVDAPFVVDYLDGCGTQLTAVILGKQSALETLFPGGSMQLAIDLYRNWSMSRYFNDIVAAAMAAVSAELPSNESLRILEIGAGTGGTTAAVLPELPRHRASYRFTDVSGFFFAAAQKDFAQYPFVEYSVLDIERSPEEQGCGRNAFHAVVAANVLHATQDLGRTLDHVLSLLKPGGLLALYEVTEPQSWIDTSVALIAGWAKSSDGFRDNGPLLTAPTWRELMRSRGFQEVAVFPEAGSPASVLGMSVILARAPLEASVEVLPTGTAEASQAAQQDAAVPALLAEIAAALPEDRIELLAAFVRDHVAAVLRRAASDEPLGRMQNLMDLGLDSLMAIELRNRLTTGLALEKQLPVSLIFDYPNIDAIARYLSTLLDGGEPASPTETAAADTAADDERARAVESLSDEEIEAMLLKKLEGSRS